MIKNDFFVMWSIILNIIECFIHFKKYNLILEDSMSVDKLKLISDKSKKEYPKFDDDSEECYEITNRFLKNINLNKKEVIIDKLF